MDIKRHGKRSDYGRYFWPIVSLAVTGLFLILMTAACTRASPLIKIGLVGPFEGRYRHIGYDTIYSVRLAVRESNETGGVGEYRLNLVALDDFGDPEIARQMARAMVADPGVVVVIGHWLTQTTDVSRPIYEQAGLPLIDAPSETLSEFRATQLPEAFRDAYAEVTPFDEEAGRWAGPAYDAAELAITAMSESWKAQGTIDRAGVLSVLSGLTYEGITGPVFSSSMTSR